MRDTDEGPVRLDFPPDEWCAYTDARVHALSQRIDSVEDRHRRLVLLLVILAYALAFGYLVGRDTCQR